jgi:hypothetical protein
VHEPTEDKSDYTKDSYYKELDRVMNQLPKASGSDLKYVPCFENFG